MPLLWVYLYAGCRGFIALQTFTLFGVNNRNWARRGTWLSTDIENIAVVYETTTGNRKQRNQLLIKRIDHTNSPYFFFWLLAYQTTITEFHQVQIQWFHSSSFQILNFLIAHWCSNRIKQHSISSFKNQVIYCLLIFASWNWPDEFETIGFDHRRKNPVIRFESSHFSFSKSIGGATWIEVVVPELFQSNQTRLDFIFFLNQVIYGLLIYRQVWKPWFLLHEIDLMSLKPLDSIIGVRIQSSGSNLVISVSVSLLVLPEIQYWRIRIDNSMRICLPSLSLFLWTA